MPAKKAYVQPNQGGGRGPGGPPGKTPTLKPPRQGAPIGGRPGGGGYPIPRPGGPNAGGYGPGPFYPKGDTPDVPPGGFPGYNPGDNMPPKATPPWAGPGGGPPPAWPPPGAEVPPVMPPGGSWSDVVPPPGGFPPNLTPATPRGGGGMDPGIIRALLAAKLAASGAGAPLNTPDPLQAALLKLKLGGGL